VTHSDHLADDVLSQLVDDQRSPAKAQAHLETCVVCQARLEEMRTLVGLLRSLPSVEPPRDFRLGPRVVGDPPNVVRLRRWYAVTRAGAGALAAAFVFLSVGALYVDSRPAAAPATLASKSQPAAQSAPDTVARDTATNVSPPPTPAPRAAAAPAVAPQPPAAGAAARSNQVDPAPTSTEPGDQIAAATTARPLPTQVPTPTLVAQSAPPSASVAPSTPQPDTAAPLRIASAIVGILSALGILVALLMRHRLRTASRSHLE